MVVSSSSPKVSFQWREHEFELPFYDSDDDLALTERLMSWYHWKTGADAKYPTIVGCNSPFIAAWLRSSVDLDNDVVEVIFSKSTFKIKRWRIYWHGSERLPSKSDGKLVEKVKLLTQRVCELEKRLAFLEIRDVDSIPLGKLKIVDNAEEEFTVDEDSSSWSDL